MNTNNIKQILNEKNLSPNKKFGQNFLCNNDISKKIISFADILTDSTVLEIGPGLGCLTEILGLTSNKVLAIEIDKGLYNYLSEKFKGNNKINIINADFLKIKVTEKIDRIVANLPYYCASQILYKCANEINPEIMIVMLQKEMAERITAKPGTKNYGSLTVILNYYFSSQILFNVDKKSFYPQPDVISSVIKLSNINKNILKDNEYRLFHNIVKSAFWGRRKTLLKALSCSPHLNYSKEKISYFLCKADIHSGIRGEMLTVENFIRLTKVICNES